MRCQCSSVGLQDLHFQEVSCCWHLSSRNCELSLGNRLNEFGALESQGCSRLARLQPGFQFVLCFILLLKEISWVAWGNSGLFTACCIPVSCAARLPGKRRALLPKLLFLFFFPFFTIEEVTVFVLYRPR